MSPCLYTLYLFAASTCDFELFRDFCEAMVRGRGTYEGKGLAYVAAPVTSIGVSTGRHPPAPT